MNDQPEEPNEDLTTESPTDYSRHIESVIAIAALAGFLGTARAATYLDPGLIVFAVAFLSVTALLVGVVFGGRVLANVLDGRLVR